MSEVLYILCHFIHLADAFIQSYSIYSALKPLIFSMCSLGIEPMTLMLLLPSSTSWTTGIYFVRMVLHAFLQCGKQPLVKQHHTAKGKM